MLTLYLIKNVLCFYLFPLSQFSQKKTTLDSYSPNAIRHPFSNHILVSIDFHLSYLSIKCMKFSQNNISNSPVLETAICLFSSLPFSIFSSLPSFQSLYTKICTENGKTLKFSILKDEMDLERL